MSGVPLSILLARLSHTLESALIVARFGPPTEETQEAVTKGITSAQEQLARIQEVAP